MKNFVIALSLGFTVFAAGCSANEADPAPTENTEENIEVTQSDDLAIKKDLLHFETAINTTVRPFHGPIATFNKLVGAEEQDPTAIAAAGEEASSAALERAEAIRQMEVPATLPQAELEEALELLAQYSEAVAVTYNENPAEADVTKANELYAQFESKLAEVWEANGLLATKFEAYIK